MKYNNTRNENENVRIALVAEDNDATRATISRYLRADGYGVLEAHTSIEALLLAVEFPDPIDVLFTSIDLRKYCNGIELAGCLRATRPEMAVVYLSDEGDLNQAAELEILASEAFCLEKPLDLGDLDGVLSAVACRNFSGHLQESINRA